MTEVKLAALSTVAEGDAVARAKGPATAAPAAPVEAPAHTGARPCATSATSRARFAELRYGMDISK